MMRSFLILSAAISLGACATVQQPPPASNLCSISRPITWSALDTRRTKAEVDAHNRVWKRIGGKKK